MVAQRVHRGGQKGKDRGRALVLGRLAQLQRPGECSPVGNSNQHHRLQHGPQHQGGPQGREQQTQQPCERSCQTHPLGATLEHTRLKGPSELGALQGTGHRKQQQTV